LTLASSQSVSTINFLYCAGLQQTPPIGQPILRQCWLDRNDLSMQHSDWYLITALKSEKWNDMRLLSVQL
jgi:hypothetical protein